MMKNVASSDANFDLQSSTEDQMQLRGPGERAVAMLPFAVLGGNCRQRHRKREN